MNEIELIKPFLLAEKVDRHCGFLASVKQRRKFLSALHHFQDFDPKVIVPLEPSWAASELSSELKRRGAGENCYVISVNSDLDQTTIPLPEAVEHVFALIEGTIIFTDRQGLAYYEGEPPRNRYILQAQAVPGK